MSEAYDFFCGLDWGNSEHEFCLIDKGGAIVGRRRTKANGEGNATVLEWLSKTAGDDPSRIAVIVERADGPIVETLIDRGFHVYVVHPKQLDRFRDRHTVSGAKDDSLDAFVAADAGRTDLHKLRRVQVAPADLLMLRELSRLRADLMDERHRLVEQMRSQLWRYFPQAIDLGVLDEAWFWAVLERFTTPALAAVAKRSAVASILKAHRIRKLEAEQVIGTLGTKPVTVAPGVVEAASMRVRSIVGRLLPLEAEIRRLNGSIEKLLSSATANLSSRDSGDAEGQKTEHRDAEIIRSLPGFGTHNAATMLAEAPDAIAHRDYEAIASRSGIVPVTQKTGKQRSKVNGRRRGKAPPAKVTMRQACNVRLREALYHVGRTAAQRDPRCKKLYDDARARGVKHGAATRIVAAHLCRVMVSMLKSRTLFSEDRRAHAVVAKEAA